MKPFRLGMALRGAYLSLHRRANVALQGLGVTADQMVVLTILAEEDGITQRELVRRVHSDPNTIAAMLKLLEERKLISRRPHATDGRARCIDLTEAGRTLQLKTETALEEVHGKLMDLFLSREAEKLLGLLERIVEGLDNSTKVASEKKG